MGEMKRQQQSTIAELGFNESWSYYQNELWYLIMLHDVQQCKVHNSWLRTCLGTVRKHLQHANWSRPHKPAVLCPWSFPAKPAQSAALACSHGAGNGVFHVLKRKSVVSSQNRTVAIADSWDYLPRAFLCGAWCCQVCYLSCRRLRWSGFLSSLGFHECFWRILLTSAMK